MATEKRIMERVISEDGSTVQVLFETSADQVTLEDAGGNYTADNVEGALNELATKVASAGKVDDVVNADGTSIVENKVAQMKNAVVKEAGKVTKGLTFAGQASDAALTSHELSFDGSVEKTIRFDASYLSVHGGAGIPNEIRIGLQDTGVVSDIYNSVAVDSKGRVYNGTKEDYALKNYVDTQDGKKLDKTGGTVTGALAVNGGLTVGGNLTVNGTTTTVDSTTLQVKDKLIEVAHGNTTKLTTPAGLVAPKYDGTNSGALVFDGDGIASVGDVVLNANGDIDTTKSQLQTLATRTGLVDGNIVKYDGTNKTLVDTGKKVGDFATAAQGATADSALTKAEAAQKDVTQLRSEVENMQEGTIKVGHATLADKVANKLQIRTTVSGAPINAGSFDGSAVRNINFDGSFKVESKDNDTTISVLGAPQVEHALTLTGTGGNNIDYSVDYDGSKAFQLAFDKPDFIFPPNPTTGFGAVMLRPTGVNAGTYSAVTVDKNGRVTAGSQIIEWGTSGQTKPTSNLVVGGLFMKLKQ